MGIARYKALCIDAVDVDSMGRFWAGALRLAPERVPSGGVRLTGRTPGDTVWVNPVPEPVSVKQRVHIDFRADSVAEVERLGATVVDADSFPWTVMRDPEGGELCVFPTGPESGPGLYELVVDCEDPVRIATWWSDVLGARRDDDDEHGFSWVERIPGCPLESIVFVPVPEPKTVKNRIHIDVTTFDVEALVGDGATLLRAKNDEIGWHVLADPEGNEFCAFVQAA